jgi:hypothetical protein
MDLATLGVSAVSNFPPPAADLVNCYHSVYPRAEPQQQKTMLRVVALLLLATAVCATSSTPKEVSSPVSLPPGCQNQWHANTHAPQRAQSLLHQQAPTTDSSQSPCQPTMQNNASVGVRPVQCALSHAFTLSPALASLLCSAHHWQRCVCNRGTNELVRFPEPFSHALIPLPPDSQPPLLHVQGVALK